MRLLLFLIAIFVGIPGIVMRDVDMCQSAVIILIIRDLEFKDEL